MLRILVRITHRLQLELDALEKVHVIHPYQHRLPLELRLRAHPGFVRSVLSCGGDGPMGPRSPAPVHTSQLRWASVES